MALIFFYASWSLNIVLFVSSSSILVRISGWIHRLPFWIPEFPFPLEFYSFLSYFYLSCLLCKLSLHHMWSSVSQNICPSISWGSCLKINVCVDGSCLVAHILNLFPLIFICHNIQGFTLLIVRIFPWTVSGSILIFQRYTTFNPLSLPTLNIPSCDEHITQWLTFP